MARGWWGLAVQGIEERRILLLCWADSNVLAGSVMCVRAGDEPAKIITAISHNNTSSWYVLCGKTKATMTVP